MMGRSAEARGCPSPGRCYRNPKRKVKGQLSSSIDCFHIFELTTKLVKINNLALGDFFCMMVT